MSKNAPKFRTPYDDDYVDKGLDCSNDPLLTVQDMAEECDVNAIVARFEKTGLLPQAVGSPIFGDFSSPIDYQTAQNVFIEADKAFMALPAKVRKEFDNSALKFLEFVDDPANADKLVEMGLREPPPEVPQVPTTTETAKAAPSA